MVMELTLRIASSLRRDVTAVALLVVNLWTVIHVVAGGHPFAAVLIVYWMQMAIIGLWAIPKIVLTAGKRSMLPVTLVLLGYLPLVYIFGLIAGGLIDNQMQGAEWRFSIQDFAFDGIAFLLSHGLSFFVMYVRRGHPSAEDAMNLVVLPYMRAAPMTFVALVGGFIAAFFDSATALAWVVVPVKIWLDLAGHAIEHAEH
jgi:hypothetical protein